MINSRKYKHYMNEISTKYAIDVSSCESLFRTAVARAYDACGSAFIWDDGTISVAHDNRGKMFHLKHYIISAKQYVKIVKIFEILLDDYSQKKDTLFFSNSMKGSLIDVKVMQSSEYGLIVRPVLEHGAAMGYKFILDKTEMFLPDGAYKKGDVVSVLCVGFNSIEKTVRVSRLNEVVISVLLKKVFDENLACLKNGFLYAYHIVNVLINRKKRTINIHIKWENKPSSGAVSFITKELNQVFGSCVVRDAEMINRKHMGETTS